jgi:hypothetical protein
LIALEGKDVVGTLIHNLRGNFLLSSHSVGSHYAAFDVENLEEFRDGFDLIGRVLSAGVHEIPERGVVESAVFNPSRRTADVTRSQPGKGSEP